MFDYSDVLKARPTVGKVAHGEVEHVENPTPDKPLGIVFQDPFLTVVREEVLFPSQARGTHLRLFEGHPEQDPFAVAILPLRPRSDGGEPDILVVDQFRYPVQGWMSEIPRGGVGPKEKTANGAVRELGEETGLPVPDIMVRMEDLVANSGLSATRIRYYMAVFLDESLEAGLYTGDHYEAISQCRWLPVSDWPHMMRESPVAGRPFGGLDSFTSAAYGLAYLTGTMRRMEISWRRVHEKIAHESLRLSDDLKFRIQAGQKLFSVGITFHSEESARRIDEELPLLNARPDDISPLTATATHVPLLTLVWLSQHAAVKALF